MNQQDFLCVTGAKICIIYIKQFDKTSSDFNSPNISALETSWPTTAIAESYGYIVNYYMDLYMEHSKSSLLLLHPYSLF